MRVRTNANFKAVRVLLGGVKHERKQDIRGGLCIKVQLEDIDREKWMGPGVALLERCCEKLFWRLILVEQDTLGELSDTVNAPDFSRCSANVT